MIAEGKTIVIVNNRVLRVDSWLKFHPGGDMAILHMVGRDATDEVTALHSPEALRRMQHYQIGTIEGAWTNFVAPIHGGTFVKRGGGGVRDEKAGGHGVAAEVSPPPRGYDEKQRPSPEAETEAETARATPSSAATYLEAQTQDDVDRDLARFPALDAETQGRIVQAYRGLGERIKAEGLYRCNYWAYAVELTRYCMLAALSIFFLRRGWYATSAFFLGLFWHQLVFSAHDAGHMAITHDFTTDTVIGIVIADFVGGLSLGWWKRSHNVHHIVTNSPEHDPDIELMPFFTVSHRFFDSLHSTYYDRIMPYDAFTKLAVRYQAWLYYPVLTLGRFNLYLLSWDYLFRGLGPRKGSAWWHRWFEIAGQLFFWTWFGYGVLYSAIPTMWHRFVFVMISHMVTAPLHVQITLSHYAMSTADLGAHESFPQKMLRTTMDVDCPPWMDFIHGGLQFQAVHHLFPRLPRHNLRRAQGLVQDFCDDVGIPYALYGFVDGNKEVIGRLGEISRQAAMLAHCQKVVAEKSISCTAAKCS